MQKISANHEFILKILGYQLGFYHAYPNITEATFSFLNLYYDAKNQFIASPHS